MNRLQLLFFVIVVMFGLMGKNSYAQDDNALYTQGNPSYYPPSPNATAMAEYGDVPVSLYNGIADINVPLYTLPGKDVNVPISLSYHASGIKVNDYAGWMGLGWTLNAGGLVTRVVRGIPDETTKGFSGSANAGKLAALYVQFTQSNATPNFAGIALQALGLPVYSGGNAQDIFNAYKQKVSHGNIDSEPDLFYYNFQGNSGMFILDENGDARTMPCNNLKIVQILHGSSPSWTITTPDGNIHYFGSSSASFETSTVTNSVNSDQQEFVSTWYLDQMHSLNNEYVYFFYASGGTIVTPYKFYSKFDYLNYSWEHLQTFDGSDQDSYGPQATTNPCRAIGASSPESVVTTNISITTKVIDQIYTTKGWVDFNYNTQTNARLDIPAAPLVLGFTVSSYDGALTKNINFTHSYFQNDQGTKRLRLDAVTTSSQDESIPPYLFSYNQTVNLPPQNSMQQDHWGYYNANTVNSLIPPGSYNGYSFTGANREPDEINIQANMLTQITYPSGGYTSFYYDANRYAVGPNLEQRIAGGVRIARILNNDGIHTNKINSKSYDYNEGGVVSTPLYQQFKIIYDHTYPYAEILDGQYDYLYRTSISYTDLGTTQGGVVGYGIVTETTVDANIIELGDPENPTNVLGTTVYNFTDFNSSPDLASRLEDPNLVVYDFQNPTALAGAPHSSLDYKRGLLLQKSVYDQGGNLKSQITNTYDFTDPDRISPTTSSAMSNTTYALRVIEDYGYANTAGEESSGNIVQPDTYSAYYYGQFWSNVFLSTTTSVQYEGNNALTTTNQYDYSQRYQLLKRVQQSRSDGTSSIVTYTYPPDYTNTSGSYSDMALYNNLKVVEKVTCKIVAGIRYVVDGTYNSYHNSYLSNGIGNLYESYGLETASPIPAASFKFSNVALGQLPETGTASLFQADARYRRTTSIDVTDPYGNIQQYHRENDNPQTIVWGDRYYHSLSSLGITSDNFALNFPIATVKNASSNQVIHTSFESSGDTDYITYGGNFTDLTGPLDYYFTGTASINTLPPARSTDTYAVYYEATGNGIITINGTPIAINEIGNSVLRVFKLPSTITSITVVVGTGVMIDDLTADRLQDDDEDLSISIATTNFNTSDHGGWNYSDENVTPFYLPLKTGNYCFNGLITINNPLTAAKLPTGENYKHKLSFWTLGTGPVNIFTSSGSSTPTFVVNATDSQKWQYHELILTDQQLSTIKIAGNVGATSVSFDELRIHPLNAQMTTSTYDLLIGKTSETDENNNTVYYEYDSLGRLKLIRDTDYNILKKYEYGYKH